MPQAILLKDVESLGEAGDVIDVSSGYLRNYLVPRKLAQTATDASIAEVRHRHESQERAQRELVEKASDNAELLNKTVLTIAHHAGEDGRLFGSVTAKEIAEAIREARDLRIEKKRIMLEEPIKQTGTYMVEIEVSSGVSASVKTIVVEQT